MSISKKTAIILKELGDLDGIKSYDFIVLQFDEKAKFKFIVDIDNEQLECLVKLELMPTSLLNISDLLDDVPQKFWMVGYVIEGIETRYTKSNIKVLLQIMKTLTEIITYHMKRKSDTHIGYFIGSRSRNPDTDLLEPDSTKYALYNAVIEKQLRKFPGMKVAETTIKKMYIEGRNVEGLFVYKPQKVG